MEFAILAAGEGSRLKKGGISGSKPMAMLNGVSLIERLMRIFLNNGAEKLHVIVNEASPDVEAFLGSLQLQVPLLIVKQNTPSSLHSFYALMPNIQSDAFCLTTVDTVFEEEEFLRYIQAFQADSSLDGLMAVTSFVDDESPLWVEADSELKIVGFKDNRSAGAGYVSGGIYCLRKSVLPTVTKAVGSGVQRMRNFQRLMLDEGLRLKAYPFSKIIDIDRKEDLELAEAWLGIDYKS